MENRDAFDAWCRGLLKEAEERRKTFHVEHVRTKQSIFTTIDLHHDPSEFRPWYEGLVAAHPEWKFIHTITEREARVRLRRGQSIDGFRILKTQKRFWNTQQRAFGGRKDESELSGSSESISKGGKFS